MAHFTYDPTAFASVAPGYSTGSTIGVRNIIRFLVQDRGFSTGSGTTSTAKPFKLSDEEIDLVQTVESNPFMMAARCARTLAANAGNVIDRKVGDLDLKYDSKFYNALAVDLEARGATYQVPTIGGISLADKLAQEADADWVPPRFFTGEFDNPRAAQPAPGQNTNPLVTTPGY